MATINLRKLFPKYELDCFVEVPDDEAEAFIAGLTEELAYVYVEFQREENAYTRRRYEYNAQYSLDRNDGVAHGAVSDSIDPVLDEYIKKLAKERLHAAIRQLPASQARRIYARYFALLSITEIAKTEGIDESAVRRSIKRGIKRIKKKIENNF